MSDDRDARIDTVVRYHERTMHRFPGRYARSLGYLDWAAQHVGQLLYLEAEAHGVAATGIGCFFDDGVHELLGIQDRDLRALYCFTVGGAVPDARIQTLPAYDATRSW